MGTLKVKATEAGVKAGFDASDVYTVDEGFVDDDTTKPLFQKAHTAKAAERTTSPATKKTAKASKRG